MNSTFLRVLAGIMVMAAIATAYVGYRISQKKPANSIAVVIPSYPQVVARQDVPAGHVLTMEDLETVSTQQPDKRSFSDPQSLVGKTSVMAVAKGRPFTSSHFPASSLLGQSLAPHERAVAIKVNEVVGVGGFIKPGDHVDVLLYLRTERETGEVSSAQVVLRNVKVLAYGSLINETESGLKEEIAPATSGKLGVENDRSSRKDSRSAILAVPEQDISKLMLADNSGILRLALRSETASTATTSTPPGNQFIRLGEVAQHTGAQPITAAPSAQPATSSKKSTTRTSKQQERVIVHSGQEVTVVNVAR